MSDWSWREDAETRNYATAWIVWGFVVVAAITLAWLFIINPLLVNKRAETLQDSYGAQQAKVAAARQTIIGFNTTNNEGQKKALANNACALIVDINEKPQDLVVFYSNEC